MQCTSSHRVTLSSRVRGLVDFVLQAPPSPCSASGARKARPERWRFLHHLAISGNVPHEFMSLYQYPPCSCQSIPYFPTRQNPTLLSTATEYAKPLLYRLLTTHMLIFGIFVAKYSRNPINRHMFTIIFSWHVAPAGCYVCAEHGPLHCTGVLCRATIESDRQPTLCSPPHPGQYFRGLESRSTQPPSSSEPQEPQYFCTTSPRRCPNRAMPRPPSALRYYIYILSIIVDINTYQ